MMAHFLKNTLERGGVVIVATDTVYGLAALPGSAGYDEIFAIKGRPREQVLAWLVADEHALDTFCTNVPNYARQLAKTFWPGALTLVLPSADAQSGATIALRCPAEESLVELIASLGKPLACTSANLHGQPPASRIEQLPASMRELCGGDSLPKSCTGGMASTIVDCTGAYPTILRQGPIPQSVVFDVAIYGATLPDV